MALAHCQHGASGHCFGMVLEIIERSSVWGLASLSFACLIGQFYGWWPMSRFACLVLLPATVLLAAIAWQTRGRPAGPRSPSAWIIQGAVGGIFAALIYDAFRLPFVLAGYPLFAVFPRFGQLLLADSYADAPSPWAHVLGWLYHFSNGAALGIMLMAMITSWTARAFIAGAVSWALAVEAFLLLTPYYSFFQLKLPQATFLILTLSAHVVFGIALGWWLRARLVRSAERPAGSHP